MSRVWCSCGSSFSDGGIPCPYQYSLIPDPKIEDLTEKIVDPANKNEHVDAHVNFLLLNNGLIVYKCPACKGILIFWDGIAKSAKYYKEDCQLNRFSWQYLL